MSGKGALADSVLGAEVVGLGGKCLGVFGGSTDDGATVGLWDCHGAAWQDWSYLNQTLVGIGGKCLDVSGAGTADGTRVQLYTCNGTVAQVWVASNGELVNPNSGKCLDVSGNDDSDGALVHLWDCWNGPNQQWSLGGAALPPAGPPADAGSPAPGDSGAPGGNGSGGGGGTGGGSGGGGTISATGPFEQYARDFLDSWGVVGGTEAAPSLVAAKLKEIGVRRIRTALVLGGQSNLAGWQTIEAAMQAVGTIKPHVAFDDLVIAYNNDLPTTWSGQKPLILDAAKAGVLGSVEGPNEMNNFYTGNGTHGVDSTDDATNNWGGQGGNIYNWAKAIHDWKASLTGDDAAAMAAVALFAPSIAVVEPDLFAMLPNLTGLVDSGNVHYYAGGGQQPNLEFGSDNSGVGYFSNVYDWTQTPQLPGGRLVLSEYGASTPPADQYSLHAQAAYILNQMHDAAGIGAQQFYAYTLFDPSTGSGGNEGNFGLAETDGTDKPVDQALSVVKDLMSLNLDYEDPANATDNQPFTAAFDRSALTVSGIGESGFSSRVTDAVAFPKSDGTTVISVTNESLLSDGHGNDVTPAPVTATVSFGSTQSWHLYDPFGSSPRTPVAAGVGSSVQVVLLGYPQYLVLDAPAK